MTIQLVGKALIQSYLEGRLISPPIHPIKVGNRIQSVTKRILFVRTFESCYMAWNQARKFLDRISFLVWLEFSVCLNYTRLSI